jgi:hypothetical protein
MFVNQTSIGRIVAHCATLTEPVQARLRISQLLQSADFTPAGFPPQAILIVRHTSGPQSISLSAFTLRSQWERDVREKIAGLYRTAVRPVRGIVPSGAPAVLFADTGEWLACMGVAVQARAVEPAWYWPASLRREASSASLTLARAWSDTPRFVPAAITYLAEWGRIVEVLQLFPPAEANAIFAAVAREWNLPNSEWQLPQRLDLPAHDGGAPLNSAGRPLDDYDFPAVAGDSSVRQAQVGRARQIETGQHGAISSLPGIDPDQRPEQSVPPPWQTWVPELKKSSEGLPPESQRLLAAAIALFHAPARVRSASFAMEVRRWLLAISKRHQSAAAPPIKEQRSAPPEAVKAKGDLLKRNSLRVATPLRSAAEVQALATSGSQRVHSKATDSVKGGTAKPAELNSDEARLAGANEVENLTLWRDLSGYETKIGGVLFLVNLIQRTGLPECFDEEMGLSQHISGWSLVEMLGKALLGPMLEEFYDDPLWAILRHLDGRAPGEAPIVSLAPIDEYRMPVEWLQRFGVLDQPCTIHASPDRFRLCHYSGSFVVVDCRRSALGVPRQAALELERYRTQGIIATLDESESDGQNASRPFFVDLELIPEWKKLPVSVRRWMCWTFPFLHYLLVRAVGEEAGTPVDLARLLLLKSGTLYCTATHIDLVMRMDQITMAVRRGGLDANPGWLLDLRRVVSFHYA